MADEKTTKITVPRSQKALKTRDSILTNARIAFTSVGYARAGLREIAGNVGVNPALILRYFGSKEELFRSALETVVNVHRMIDCERDRFGAHMADLLNVSAADALPMMLLSLSEPAAREVSQSALQERIVDPLAAWLGPPDAEARATEIVMLSMGYVLYSRMLRLRASGDKAIDQWLAEALQQIADRQ
ncbi:MAG: TetR family transcriptional regulator [Novosphingobium sp.]|nr:TetR family transcriptional regulator [Novosphingobium sp.]